MDKQTDDPGLLETVCLDTEDLKPKDEIQQTQVIVIQPEVENAATESGTDQDRSRIGTD